MTSLLPLPPYSLIFFWFFLKKFTYLFYFFVESRIDTANRSKRKTFAVTIRIRIFQFLIVIQTTVYAAERFILHWNLFDLRNPRFIIESGFKSRKGYNGARTVIFYIPIHKYCLGNPRYKVYVLKMLKNWILTCPCWNQF